MTPSCRNPLTPFITGADLLASTGLHVFIPDIFKGNALDLPKLTTMAEEKYVFPLVLQSCLICSPIARNIMSSRNGCQLEESR
jgi:hypothetical protein